MSDLIDRQKLLNSICKGCGYIGYCHPFGEKCAEYKIIENAPSVQSEIVHCNECMYSDGYDHCMLVSWWNVSDDYCSRAERREEKRRNSMKCIEKKKVLDAVFNGCGQCNEEIEDLSTLDVVLCKYCTHSHFDELHEEYWCHDAIEAKQVSDEDFCSRWKMR